MAVQPAAPSLSCNVPLLGSFLDKIIHPLRDPDLQPSDEPPTPADLSPHRRRNPHRRKTTKTTAHRSLLIPPWLEPTRSVRYSTKWRPSGVRTQLSLSLLLLIPSPNLEPDRAPG